MSILNIIKFLLPFLMSAAEKSFKKLPKEQQETLKTISKLIEVIKHTKGKPIEVVLSDIKTHTGLAQYEAGKYLIAYLRERGIVAGSLAEAIAIITQEIDKRGETGVKGFFQEMMSIIGNVIAGVDWKVLALGIGEMVFRKFVKGKL